MRVFLVQSNTNTVTVPVRALVDCSRTTRQLQVTGHIQLLDLSDANETRMVPEAAPRELHIDGTHAPTQIICIFHPSELDRLPPVCIGRNFGRRNAAGACVILYLIPSAFSRQLRTVHALCLAV